MEDGSRSSWIFLVILLLLGAVYFALSETAFASVSRAYIRSAAEKGNARAAKAQYVLDHFDRAISTILIGTNIIHISTASIVTVNVTRIWGMSAVTASTLVTTIVVFFAGEMLPKSIAKKYPERLSLTLASSLSFVMKVFYPLSSLLTWIGQTAARLMKADTPVSVTEDEIYDIIEDMTEEGSLDEEQGDLISSALQFKDVTVESILTPRVDLVAVDIDAAPEDTLELIRSQNHSRLPVYEGSVDHIIGILQIRKYLKHYIRNGTVTDLRSLLDDPFFIHQSAKVDEVLEMMTQHRMNLAVVTDNYGGTLGIVTVENILEELVGEIWDEDDVVKEPIVNLPDGSFRVEGDECVTDVFEHMDYEDPEDNEELVNTLMGEWAYEQFVEIPGPGDHFRYHDLLITVETMDHNRICSLNVRRLTPEEAAAADEADSALEHALHHGSSALAAEAAEDTGEDALTKEVTGPGADPGPDLIVSGAAASDGNEEGSRTDAAEDGGES